MKNLYRGTSEKWDFSGKFACDSEKIWVLTSSNTLQELTSGLSAEILLDEEIRDLIKMDYLQVDAKLFFVTKTSLISYSLESESCVFEGEMASEILDAKWSPSQDFLVLVLENGAVFLQNTELEVIKVQQISLKPSKACISWRNDNKFFQICGNSEKGFLVYTFDNNGEIVQTPIVSDTKGPVQSVCDNETLLSSHLISWHQSQIAGMNESNSILLWEKNGLTHEKFSVFGAKILKIGWSPDGKIMTVVSDKGLELYCKMNYHWYFKYFLEGGTDFEWAEDWLIIACNGIIKTKFNQGFSEHQGSVAVIDGLQVSITNFKDGIIPPPMSHHIHSSTDPINFTSFTDDEILIIGSNVSILPSKTILLPKPVENAVKIGQSLYFSLKNQLFKLENSEDTLINTYSHNILQIKVHKSKVYLQTEDGSVFSSQTLIHKFPKPAEELVLIDIKGKTEVFGVSNGILYAFNTQFCNNCTSLYCSEDFLFFTKKNAPYDTLFIFHSSDLPWTKPLPDPSSEHFYSRSIEKTSAIVSVFDCSLVLEHSRGNLETICPRLLILYKTEHLVKEKQYLEAFKLLREHKIDLNLLYDIDKQQFDVKLFVGQIRQQEYLNLFLTCLKDQDLTCKYFLKEFEEVPGKTNFLCDQIRGFLEPETQVLSILTSYVVKSPPEIETALIWVEKLIAASPKKNPRAPHDDGSKTHHSPAEDALKYLSWLVNPDKLYNVALSMFDLQLTSSLAKYTQKDPKEYLPYLNALNSMGEVEKRYQICMDLKNYQKALEELVKGGSEYREKAIDLITAHKLYLKGLELMPGKDVYNAIAEALTTSEFSLHAGALFELCENYPKAQELYVKSEEWDLACKMSDLTSELQFRESLSSKCAEIGRYESAAKLLEPFDQELTKIKYWVQAGKYKQAAISAKSVESKTLLRSTLKNYSEDLSQILEKNLKIFKEKKVRLDYVQQTKKMMPNEGKVLNDEVASQYSMNSMSSRVTQVSKKQRKNNAKIRKAAAKEGSVYEEDYLVDLLVSLRPDNAIFEKVEGLCYGLVVTGDFLTGKKLWELFETVKKDTFVTLSTLRQAEFLQKFYEEFTDIGKSEENDSRLKDMFAKSQFLADGLTSHKLSVFPTSNIGRFFNSF